jgi:hypothetical protein
LEKQIDYFDRNYQREGLPQEWYVVNDVGFSIKRQMALLEGNDSLSLKKWGEQTKQDLLGFGLEYLQQGTVFPFKYEVQDSQLVDAKYGHRRMVDTVDPKERNGAVLESLKGMQRHLLEGGNGATAIMVSPPGETGLTMDDGRAITYNDYMVFHMQNRNGEVTGTTLRVGDIDLNKLMPLLTGQNLPASATTMDVVRMLSLGTKDSSMDINSLVGILEKVSGTRFAYQDKTWDDMRADLARREFLYDFDTKVQQIVDDLELFVSAGPRSTLEIQKALAATFLRLSKHMLYDQKEERENPFGKRGVIFMTPTYGQIVNEVKKLPGCNGGGENASTSILSIINRSAVIGSGTSDTEIEAEIEYKFDQPGPCLKCKTEGDNICGPCRLCKRCDIDIRRKEKTMPALKLN